MNFNKYAKIKAFANLAACITLACLLYFAFYRSFWDALGAVDPPEGGNIMYVGIGAIIMILYWFLDITLLIGGIFSLVSAILLFPRGGSFRKKRVGLLLGRIGKFFAFASLFLLLITATTLLSRCVYGFFCPLFLASAILDLIFTRKAKRQYVPE